MGFEVNPYDICVANYNVGIRQHTITWRVDNLKLSRVNLKVTDEFMEWLQKVYANNIFGEFNAKCGKVHDHLGQKSSLNLKRN